ncbi:hypothetical protein CLOM_g19500, partial [Closterium sp. NIES-68]
LWVCCSVNARAVAVDFGVSGSLAVVAERRHDDPSPVVQREARRRGASPRSFRGREEAIVWFSILVRARRGQV